jgi:glycosyltransferase involved in cell wall biosynthesis
MLLTIAIPTYNRANRLDKCLSDLFFELNKSVWKYTINVLVSNNGSLDNTFEVIAKHHLLFSTAGIQFSSISSLANQGFDSNVLSCYRESNSEYVWFLSDDDNIKTQVINIIINDIINFRPSLIYYNHDQYPYTLENPYINEKKFYDINSPNSILLLQKIIKWPKLSSYVVKKIHSAIQLIALNSGFHHIALALECALSEGKILLSPVFNANPDIDYLENIDFPPYIGNGLNLVILNALKMHNKIAIFHELAIEITDPLISSLNTLGAYYRGKHVLTLSLKGELWGTVEQHLKLDLINRILDLQLIKELLKFIISLCYNFLFSVFTGKKISKIRSSPSDAKLL